MSFVSIIIIINNIITFLLARSYRQYKNTYFLLDGIQLFFWVLFTQVMYCIWRLSRYVVKKGKDKRIYMLCDYCLDEWCLLFPGRKKGSEKYSSLRKCCEKKRKKTVIVHTVILLMKKTFIQSQKCIHLDSKKNSVKALSFERNTLQYL